MIKFPKQTVYDTFACWLLTRLLADLAHTPPGSPSSLPAFFKDLYADMLANPQAYAIPPEGFIPFLADESRSPQHTAQHEALKAARMRVRKAVFAHIEFLFNLGLSGTPAGERLFVPRVEFDRLTAQAAKKAKSRQVLSALSRGGLVFSAGDPVIVTNTRFPQVPAALAVFSRACSFSKEHPLYLFQRCDLAALNGKGAPDFSDALNMAPADFRELAAQTDARLAALRFKREIFVDNYDVSYRLRYGKKGDALVFWMYFGEAFQPDLAHFLRWKLDGDLTARLFTRLEHIQPGLSGQIFNQFKACVHCYANCIERTLLTWDGVTREVCHYKCWEDIGYQREDYETLWLVLETFIEVLAK